MINKIADLLGVSTDIASGIWILAFALLVLTMTFVVNYIMVPPRKGRN